MKPLRAIVITGLVAAVTSTALAGGGKVPYPQGYRQWQHVKTMVILKGHAFSPAFQGIHHIYANKKAMAGLASGEYQDGSVLVLDLLEEVEGDFLLREGGRKYIAVMHKSHKAYPETGGWGFEGFARGGKDKRMVKDMGAECFACHKPQGQHGYVFSKYRK